MQRVTTGLLTSSLIVGILVGAPAKAPDEHAPYDAAISPAASEKFVLQVGINEYSHFDDLDGCVQDILDLKQLLRGKDPLARDKYDFPEKSFVTLLNQQASHTAIVNAFKTHLIANAKKERELKHPDAIVVFQYSGHGSQIMDVPGGEEADKWDETLVPFDSNHKTGKNTDITDDEIDELFKELSLYTSNIAFILDSCHSGSGTRGDPPAKARKADPDLRRPEPRRVTGAIGRGQKSPDAETTDMLPPGEKYVTISSSRADERSYERIQVKGRDSKTNGLMTYYLLEALRQAKPETTYREVMDHVSKKVTAENRSQHPQVEGDLRRPVLAGAANREDPFIPIESVEGNTLTLKAGEVHGVTEGTVISIYAPDARTLVGEQKKLATATIKTAEFYTSTAQVTSPKPIPVDAKIVIVSPNFGANRLRVKLDAEIQGSSTEVEADTLTSLKTMLVGTPEKPILNRAMQIVTSAGTKSANVSTPAVWDVEVRRDKFGNVFKDERDVTPDPDSAYPKCNPGKPLPSKDSDVYYIAAPEDAVLGFFVEPNDPRGAEKLRRALESLANQRWLIALDNPSSKFKGRVEVSLVRVDGQFPDCNEKKRGVNIAKQEPIVLAPTQKDHRLDQGVFFRLRIKNNSQEDLYITLFDIAVDGSISIFYPENRTDAPEKLAVGAEVTTERVYKLTGPPGVETFKVIATTEETGPRSFFHLTQPEVTRGVKVTGVDQYGDWTTAQISVVVNKQRVK